MGADWICTVVPCCDDVDPDLFKSLIDCNDWTDFRKSIWNIEFPEFIGADDPEVDQLTDEQLAAYVKALFAKFNEGAFGRYTPPVHEIAGRSYWVMGELSHGDLTQEHHALCELVLVDAFWHDPIIDRRVGSGDDERDLLAELLNDRGLELEYVDGVGDELVRPKDTKEAA